MRLVAVLFTLTGMCVAPTGTVTFIDVAVAAVTVAFVAPKYTMLLAGVVLKLVPSMVTDVPGLAGLGETEVTVGGKTSGLLRITDRLFEALLLTTISGLLSPSRSPSATYSGVEAVAKSDRGARDPEVNAPDVVVFLNTDTLPAERLLTTMSTLPSPFISAIARPSGPALVVKSTFVAKEPDAIVPLVAVFRISDSVYNP